MTRPFPHHGLTSAAVLALPLMLFCAGARSQSEAAPEDVTGSFNERYSDQGELPTFMQPDIAALFSTALPLIGASTLAPVTEVVTVAPEPTPPEQDVAATEHKTPGEILKDLLVPPAESAPASPPPSESAAAAPEPTLSNPAPAPVVAANPVAARDEREILKQSAQQPARRIGAGRAAWYGHPGRTASGETFNPSRLTAAHRSLPFGTRVRVVNRERTAVRWSCASTTASGAAFRSSSICPAAARAPSASRPPPASRRWPCTKRTREPRPSA